jgi:uncharacterized protein YbaP (TraB family)
MTFKKVFIAFVIVGILLIPGCSGKNSYTDCKSFLWEIDFGTEKSYLFGTISFLKKENFPLNKKIEDAFEESEVLLVPVDDTIENIPKIKKRILEECDYREGEFLQNNISANTFQLVIEKMEEFGMHFEIWKTSKSWAMGLSIFAFQRKKMGYNRIDKYFMDKALGKKKIAEITGMEYDFEVFESFSKEENEQFLLGFISRVNQIYKIENKMLDAWYTGDAKKLEQIYSEYYFSELESLNKKLCYDRIERIGESIISHLKTGKKCFIVESAIFMVGEEGIVQLLKKKGIKIKRL